MTGSSSQETLVTSDDHGERTGQFSADDVTQSHSVRFAAHGADVTTHLNSQLHHSLNLSLPSKEETAGFAAGEATMDITQCLTANIQNFSASDSALFTGEQDEMFDPQKNRSSVRHHSQTGIKDLSTNTNVNPRIVQKAQSAVQSSEGFTTCPDDDVCMDLTEAQTGYILEGCLNTDGAEHPQYLPPSQGPQPQSVNLRQERKSSHQESNKDNGSSAYKGTGMTNLLFFTN